MEAAHDGPPRRCFVALPLPDAAHAGVTAATDRLRGDIGAGIRWTDSAVLHLTLRFLGDIAPDVTERLRTVLDAVAGRLTSCDLRLVGAGAFPSLARPRVLWIGVEQTPTLVALHEAVDAACAAAGLGREPRPFHPHLTVGRLRTGVALPEAPLAAALARVGFVASARAASFHLMHSELTRTGARHTPLAAFDLRGVVALSGGAR